MLSYPILMQFSMDPPFQFYWQSASRKKFTFCFRIVCIIVVLFMIGYWFYKYEIEDRDIGVVDYVSLEDAKYFDFPLEYTKEGRKKIGRTFFNISNL